MFIFIDPDDLWRTFIYSLIALIVILIIYGLIFLEAIKEKEKTLNPVAFGLTTQNKIVSENITSKKKPLNPIKIETAMAAPVENENNIFYVQITTPVLRVRSGPSTEFPIVRRFDKGMIIRVKKAIDEEKEVWYEIQQNSFLRYPERVINPWFIAGRYEGEWLTKRIESKVITVFSSTQPEDKYIKIDISEQTLQAFEKDKLVLETLVSTGKFTKKYKTPVGNFRILRKELSVYMQGPLPNDDEYFDLPGIPFVLYFTNLGHAIHGTYWHNDFGNPRSHGCINVPIEKAEFLYWWADIKTRITITE